MVIKYDLTTFSYISKYSLIFILEVIVMATLLPEPSRILYLSEAEDEFFPRPAEASPLVNATNSFNYINDTAIRNSTELGTAKCEGDIEVDSTSPSFKKAEIDCVIYAIKVCRSQNLSLIYQMGSLKAAIIGLTSGICTLDLTHEIERGQDTYLCLVPSDKLSNWNSWKENTGLDAVVDILPYCKHIETRRT